PLERSREARPVVRVAVHHFGAGARQGARLVRIGVARDRAQHELPALVGEKGACEPAALGTGGTHHRNDLPVRHEGTPFLRFYDLSTKGAPVSCTTGGTVLR